MEMFAYFSMETYIAYIFQTFGIPTTYRPAHEISVLIASASSKGSDNLRIHTRVFAARIHKVWMMKVQTKIYTTSPNAHADISREPSNEVPWICHHWRLSEALAHMR